MTTRWRDAAAYQSSGRFLNLTMACALIGSLALTPPDAKAGNGSVRIITDATCLLALDGAEHTRLDAGEATRVTLAAGPHTLRCTDLGESGASVTYSLSLASGEIKELSLPMAQEITRAQRQAELQAMQSARKAVDREKAQTLSPPRPLEEPKAGRTAPEAAAVPSAPATPTPPHLLKRPEGQPKIVPCGRKTAPSVTPPPEPEG